MPINGYFDIPFAENGDLNTIPDATQPSGTVSYNQGFPVGYSTPVASGGINVPRTAFNQVLFDITSAVQNWQQNTVAPFITPTMNGGTPYSYPANAMVLYGGNIYISLVGSNADTPPSAKWQLLAIRTRLTANTTFYVSTTGSNSNNGLSSGAAWLTIQHAWDAICTQYDLAGFTATIQLADGTYTTGLVAFNGHCGAGLIAINGNAATPSNVVISTTSADAMVFDARVAPINVVLSNLKVTTATSGNGVRGQNHAVITLGAGLIFGACANYQISSLSGALVNPQNGYLINGGAQAHLQFVNGTIELPTGITITLSGTPAFSQAFAAGSECGDAQITSGITFSGSATGSRYTLATNAVINTFGSGTSYLPGSTAGTTATGGQYV